MSSASTIEKRDVSANTVNGIFGAKLRSQRRARNLSQAQLGKKVGISRVTVANLESGRQNVQLHQLFALADGLDTSPEGLMPTAGELERNDQTLHSVRTDLLVASDVLFMRWAKNQFVAQAE